MCSCTVWFSRSSPSCFQGSPWCQVFGNHYLVSWPLDIGLQGEEGLRGLAAISSLTSTQRQDTDCVWNSPLWRPWSSILSFRAVIVLTFPLSLSAVEWPKHSSMLTVFQFLFPPIWPIFHLLLKAQSVIRISLPLARLAEQTSIDCWIKMSIDLFQQHLSQGIFLSLFILLFQSLLKTGNGACAFIPLNRSSECVESVSWASSWNTRLPW